MIGPPACGKTYWRNNYLKKALRPTIVISSDDLLEEWARNNSTTYTEAFNTANLQQIEKTFMENFQSALSNGNDIIIDRTNMTVKTRNKFLAQIPKDYQRHAIIFEISRHDLQVRLDQRAISGKIIPTIAVDNFISNYIPPTIDEKFDSIEKVIF